jgi:hypothetical protein
MVIPISQASSTSSRISLVPMAACGVICLVGVIPVGVKFMITSIHRSLVAPGKIAAILTAHSAEHLSHEKIPPFESEIKESLWWHKVIDYFHII